MYVSTREIPAGRWLLWLCGIVICAGAVSGDLAAAERPPNVVIIFADDMGYGDPHCFGSTTNQTPQIDRMAQEGRRFTNFCVAQAVCSASRAALLTGCYPNRIGIQGALAPQHRHGLHADEWTIAEVLKQKGYATAIYGKWHLGHHQPFLPIHHGFDDYLGLPYSNDMWPRHPTAKFPELPLIAGDQVIELNPDQSQLTTRYTERAVQFIETHRDEPFFLYVPHAMPHVPLFVSENARGSSQHGLYGDVMSEIDWSVGEILQTIKRCGLDEQTLVIFTSDNGPWLVYGNHAGSSGPLREGKGSTWEGGMRVPFIARWPGRIAPGSVTDEFLATIDILPTVAALTGAALPSRRIDGLDASNLLVGESNAKSPREAYYYYWGNELHAIRSGPWKLHFPHHYVSVAEVGGEGRPGRTHQLRTDLALYNLTSDIGEQTNVADSHPEIVQRLQALADQARDDLGDTLQKKHGSGVRPAGMLDTSVSPAK